MRRIHAAALAAMLAAAAALPTLLAAAAHARADRLAGRT
jgi:hypothetical protein